MLIIFDLDDTLVDTSLTVLPVKFKRALLEVKKAGLNLNFSLKEALKHLLDINQNMPSAKEALETFFKKFSLPENPYLKLANQVVYEGELGQIKILPVPDALLVLRDLKQKHRLVLVTIGEEKLQKEKLKKAGIDTAFFSIIEVAKEKAKKKSYIRICQDLDFAFAETVVIGDKVEADLRPAKELGCSTVLMRRGRGLSQKTFDCVDFKIGSLLELENIVDGLKVKSKGLKK